jgi:5'-3' exonuclease
MNQSKYQIMDQFPKSIILDMMNKTWLHECIPLLPPLDNKLIVKKIYDNKLTSPTNKTENIITF